ncbi:MAG: class I SAM-dependent methyltransferase [Nitrospiraceae bacterium]|nr:class I SAM-dependent methyltransferase [Nitrospiraceae bacterium]
MKQLPLLRRPYFSRRILEIGPGDNPFKGVTHLLEMDVHEGRERGGNALFVPKAAKLIVAEATLLPFGPGTFDYVYASHVLEHVEQPERACREIMRVGRAGYIETPSPFLEQGMALREKHRPSTGFTGGSYSLLDRTVWCSSRKRPGRSGGSVRARTGSFCGNFTVVLIFAMRNIASGERPRQRPSTGRETFWWKSGR